MKIEEELKLLLENKGYTFEPEPIMYEIAELFYDIGYIRGYTDKSTDYENN